MASANEQISAFGLTRPGIELGHGHFVAVQHGRVHYLDAQRVEK